MTFDLEAQLEQWKQGFADLEAMRSADVDELEQHVRDSMAGLTALGLSAEEAFIVATRRTGAPGPVGREFAKVNGSHLWTQRVLWMAAGALGYVVCGLVIGALASLGQVIASVAGGSGVAAGFTGVAVTCLGWGAVAVLLYRRLYARPGGYPWTTLSAGALGGFAALAVGSAVLIKLGSELAVPRWMPVRDLAQAVAISHVAALIWTVLMPFVLLVVAVAIGRHLHDARAADR